MPELIPAILPKSFAELEEKVRLVCGLVDTVQIDFCDGTFVPNQTGPFTEKGGNGVKGRKRKDEKGEKGKGLPHREEIDFEAHLMVTEPLALIATLVKNGFSRVLVHAERVSPEVFADLIHEWRGAVEIGAVLKLETPIEAIDSFAHELKTLQLMGIAHIGKQGEPFDARVVARVRGAHARFPHLTVAVDGGVSLKNASALIAAGASRLVVGSAIFGAPDPRAAIEQFKNLLY